MGVVMSLRFSVQLSEVIRSQYIDQVCQVFFFGIFFQHVYIFFPLTSVANVTCVAVVHFERCQVRAASLDPGVGSDSVAFRPTCQGLDFIRYNVD